MFMVIAIAAAGGYFWLKHKIKDKNTAYDPTKEYEGVMGWKSMKTEEDADNFLKTKNSK